MVSKLVRQILRKKQRDRCCYCLVKMTLSDKAPAHTPANAETIGHLERRCNAERGAFTSYEDCCHP